MANELSDDVEVSTKLLMCGSCKDAFDDKDKHPRVLPCLHTFCFLCLQTLYQGNRVVCPCCFEYYTFQGIDWNIFPRDNTRKDSRVLLQFSQSRWPQKCEMCEGNSTISYRCKQCEIYICNECFFIHKRVRKLKHHELIPVREENEGTMLSNNLERMSADVQCPEHMDENEILRIYCSSCRKPICPVCAVDQHHGHTLSLLSRVYVEEKEKSKILYSQVQGNISAIESMLDLVNEERENVSSHAVIQRKSIVATFANAQAILCGRENELKSEIEDLYKQKSKILCSQAESLQSLKDSCIEACLFLEHSFSYKNKPAFLEISQAIFLRLLELSKMSFDSYPHATAKSFRSIKTEKLISFQDVVNKLLSVAHTEANTYHCQISCSSHCLLDFENQITINIVSSNGSMTLDENIRFTVVRNGKSEVEINQLSTTCQKNWKPQNTGMYLMTLSSNGIEIAEKVVCVEQKRTGVCQINKDSKEHMDIVLCMKIGPKNGEMAYSLRCQPAQISSSTSMDLARNSYQDGGLAILYDQNEDAIAFGNDAEKQYANCSEMGCLTSYQIRKISEEEFESGNKDSSKSDLDERVLNMVSSYLRHFEELIGKGRMVTKLAVVLILPPVFLHIPRSVICSKLGNRFQELIIISETDSIFFLGNYSTKTFLSLQDKIWHGHFSPGCRYMLINCEVSSKATVIQADEEYKYRTLHSDKTVGLGYIHDCVLDIIKNIFGQDVFESFKTKERFSYLSMMEDIHTKRRASMKSVENFSFPLHIDILFMYHEMKSKAFTLDVVKDKQIKDCIEFRRKKLFLHVGFILEDAFQRVIRFAKQKLLDYKTNTIILYGELANSEYFLSLFTKHLPDIRIIVPEVPDLAALNGGVIYGHL